MVKIISCRVVRSKPLGKSSDTLRHAGRPNHFRHKIGDVNPQCKSTNDTVIYTRMLEITRVSVDNGLAGQILDCYV